MRFANEAERQLHPQVRLIPISLWEDVFRKELPDEFILLMQSQDQVFLMSQLARWADSRFRVKQSLLFAIALSRESFDKSFLFEAASQLGFSLEYIFLFSVVLGNMELLQTCLVEVGVLSRTIANHGFGEFLPAVYSGNFETIERLNELVYQDQLQTMLAVENFSPFRCAARYGHLDMLNRLVELVAPDQLQVMVAADSFKAFYYVCAHGHLAILHRLVDLVAPDELQTMIAAYDFDAFRSAAYYGRLETVNYLIELVVPGELNIMLASENFGAFRGAVKKSQVNIVNRLLDFPIVLAFAEENSHEYGALVLRFIREKLISFRQRHYAFEREHSEVKFDLEDMKQVTLCFYMLKALIRRNDPVDLDDIRFLLIIPAVRDLVSKTIMSRHPKDLLRLALVTENIDVVRILLNIPGLNITTETADFYRETEKSRLDLSILLQHRQLPMQTLITCPSQIGFFAPTAAALGPQQKDIKQPARISMR